VTFAPAWRWTLFGQEQLLAGEDDAAYHELLAHIRAAVKPPDFIQEMLIADVASLEWEVLRWRRLKSTLIRACGLAALQEFLAHRLDYNLYSKHFADELTQILQDHVSQDHADDAQALAHACAQNEADAINKVNEILNSINMDMDRILKDAQANRAQELVQEYVRREPNAVTMVHELLAGDGVSMDDFMADALVDKLDYIERIDRLTAIAENRRNDSLHEIDKRRAILGATLRQTVQEIEEGEFKVIETTRAKGKNGA
jgi:hypothetical protein